MSCGVDGWDLVEYEYDLMSGMEYITYEREVDGVAERVMYTRRGGGRARMFAL